jgi:hypothetical protein
MLTPRGWRGLKTQGLQHFFSFKRLVGGQARGVRHLDRWTGGSGHYRSMARAEAWYPSIVVDKLKTSSMRGRPVRHLVEAIAAFRF